MTGITAYKSEFIMGVEASGFETLSSKARSGMGSLVEF